MNNTDKTIGIEIIAVCFIMPGAAFLMVLWGIGTLYVIISTWNSSSWGDFLLGLFSTSLGIPFFHLGYSLRRKSYPSWISSIIGLNLLGLLLSVVIFNSSFTFLGRYLSLLILIVTLISFIYLIWARDEFTEESRTNG